MGVSGGSTEPGAERREKFPPQLPESLTSVVCKPSLSGTSEKCMEGEYVRVVEQEKAPFWKGLRQLTDLDRVDLF